MPAKKQSEKTNTNIEFHQRLYRSEINRILGGVCGGLGEYFKIDPTIIRIIFVVMVVFGGSGLLIYLLLWLIIPSFSSKTNLTHEDLKANAREMRDKAQKFADQIRKRENTANKSSVSWWGFLILILGLILLLNNYGVYDFSEIKKLWPLLLVLFGVSVLLKK